MIDTKLTRVVASVVAVSLVMTAPGPRAWAAGAAVVRASVPLRVRAAATLPAPTLASPILALPAPALASPRLAASAPSAAPSIVITGLAPAAADLRGLEAAPAASVSWTQRAAALFDGVLAEPAPRLAITVALPASDKDVRAIRAALKKTGFRLFSGSRVYIQDGMARLDGSVPAARFGDLVKAHQRLAADLRPEGPDQEPSGPPSGSRDGKAAAKPAREPFVPASKVVADLEALLVKDPAAALAAAAETLNSKKEKRVDVKIGAVRVLAALPVAQALPVYEAYLKDAAAVGVQTNKDNKDSIWYLQRQITRRIAAEAEAVKAAGSTIVETLKATYKDRNASVRLAAAHALTQLGVEPGPEIDYSPKELSALKLPPSASEPQPYTKAWEDKYPRQQKTNSKPGNGKKLLAWGVLAMWLFFAYGMFKAVTNPVPPKTQTAGQQVAGAANASPAAPAAPVVPKTDAERLAAVEKSLERIASASETTAKATAELAKPKGSMLGSLVSMLLPILLLVFLFRFFMSRGGGGAGGLGGMQKPKMSLEKPTTRFSDVAGIDESMVEVQEIVDFLANPAEYKKLGARMPKGVLLEGPPGTGKTLLARALAGETNAAFISISGSAFVELFVGMGASRVRQLFDAARQNAPAIIFIDEIDAVGKQRGGPSLGGGTDEREQTINQILAEMDGFDNSSGVIVIAATNQAASLDKALVRPGRFDRKIHVGKPELLGREAILSLHARAARLAAEVDLNLIARRAAGLAGADLANVINEAALQAARRVATAISAADVDEAVDRATIGPKRSLKLADALKRLIAIHEAGHVLANLLHENPELRTPVNKVTIIPHGSGALGFAESGSEEGDKYLYTREELEARLDMIVGGLVAEKIFYGSWSTGPGSDLEQGTRIASVMVQQLGMSEEMGLAQTAPNPNDPLGRSPFGEAVGAKAHAEVNRLLKEALDRTEKRLRAGAAQHQAMIDALMEKETLSASEILAIAHPSAAQ